MLKRFKNLFRRRQKSAPAQAVPMKVANPIEAPVQRVRFVAALPFYPGGVDALGLDSPPTGTQAPVIVIQPRRPLFPLIVIAAVVGGGLYLLKKRK